MGNVRPVRTARGITFRQVEGVILKSGRSDVSVMFNFQGTAIASIARAAALVVLLVATSAYPAEQSYPTRPVRIIASGVGTTSDLLSRQLGQELSERWRQPVIVDNRAGGAVGAAIRAAVTATPDGYTLVMGEANNLALAPVVYDKPPYDPLNDVDPITLVARTPLILLTHPSVPVSNLRELVAYAKQSPGKLTYGSAALGGVGHLSHALFTQMTGVDVLHVPYKGAAAAMLAVISGEVQLSSGATSTAMAQIKAGKVKALAVLSSKRSQALPEVPTAAESGLPGFEVDTWFALAAPARTPPAIVARVNRDVSSILNTPAMQERFLSQGAEASSSRPEQLAAFMRSEIAKWTKVVKAAGIKIE
jgi:tripartite-type tricarboxylate transporter receptor subunit TctC